MIVRGRWSDAGACTLLRTRPLCFGVVVVTQAMLMRTCCGHLTAAREVHGLRSVLDLAWALLGPAFAVKALA
jgi:hypothetical protein